MSPVSLTQLSTAVLWLILLQRVRIVAQTIKAPLTNSQIRQAVVDWQYNREKAMELYGHISDWDTSEVTSFDHLFYNYETFEADISAWDTSRATTMAFMFRNAKAFTAKRSAGGRVWQTGNVTTMRSMFSGASSFTTGDGVGLPFWDVSRVTSMNRMFQDATKFRGDVSRFNVGLCEDFTSMFQEADSLEKIDVSSWNVAGLVAMDYMFYGTQNLEQDICFGSTLPERVTAWQMFCCSQSEFSPDCLKGHPRKLEILSDSQECPYSGRTCGIRNNKQRKIVIVALTVVMAISFCFVVWKYIPTTYIKERTMALAQTVMRNEHTNLNVEPPLEEEGHEYGDAVENSHSPHSPGSSATPPEEFEARC